jgi:hypothetical protein
LITASHPSFWNNEKVPDPAAADRAAALAPLATTGSSYGTRGRPGASGAHAIFSKTNIVFMKSPGKLLNTKTRQMTTLIIRFEKPAFQKWRLDSSEYLFFRFMA